MQHGVSSNAYLNKWQKTIPDTVLLLSMLLKLETFLRLKILNLQNNHGSTVTKYIQLPYITVYRAAISHLGGIASYVTIITNKLHYKWKVIEKVVMKT